MHKCRLKWSRERKTSGGRFKRPRKKRWIEIKEERKKEEKK